MEPLSPVDGEPRELAIGIVDNTTAPRFAQATTAFVCDATPTTTSEYPSSAQTSIRCNASADRALASWIDPCGLTPVALCHVDGFELAGDPKQTTLRARVRLAGQQHNHSSAGMIPSRNRTQNPMKFRDCCRVLTASRQPGLSLDAEMAHWLRPKPAKSALFSAGDDRFQLRPEPKANHCQMRLAILTLTTSCDCTVSGTCISYLRSLL